MPSRPTVLIVEDDAIIATDLELTVSRLGYRPVGTAATGEDAVEQARILKPDVILMDVRLEGRMDGIEAARLIRAERQVGFVYITATQQSVAETGYDQIVPKPFTVLELRTALERALTYSETETS